jgi:transposase
MRLTEKEIAVISALLPVQRGNVVNENLTFLNAVLYVAENGCKWRSLPQEYGKWNSIYKKANRWAKSEQMGKKRRFRAGFHCFAKGTDYSD